MVKIWEIQKTKGLWSTPQITVSVEGIDKLMPLTEILKTWSDLADMVMAQAVSMKNGFHVYVNGKEIGQEEADIPLTSVKTLVISSKAIIEPKTLAEKIEEAEEKVAKKMPKSIVYGDKTEEKSSQKKENKHHRHAGIVGYHKKTDRHTRPEAQKAHDKAMKEEK